MDGVFPDGVILPWLAHGTVHRSCAHGHHDWTGSTGVTDLHRRVLFGVDAWCFQLPHCSGTCWWHSGYLRYRYSLYKIIHLMNSIIQSILIDTIYINYDHDDWISFDRKPLKWVYMTEIFETWFGLHRLLDFHWNFKVLIGFMLIWYLLIITECNLLVMYYCTTTGYLLLCILLVLFLINQ